MPHQRIPEELIGNGQGLATQQEIDTISEKITEMALKTMGAKFDGITDDATIISNYINVIPSSGDKIRIITLPAKIIAASTITITTPNIFLRGNKGTILKKLSSAPSNEDFIKVLADDVIIENIEFDNNGTSNGYLVSANQNVSPYEQRKNITIRGLKFKANHANSKGIMVGYYDGVEISDCILENTFGTPNQYSFGIAVWSDQYIYSSMMTKNIFIHRNRVKGFYHGINSYGTGTTMGGNRQRMFIESNIVEKSINYGIYSYHSPRSVIAHNWIRNCTEGGIWSDSGGDYEYEYSEQYVGMGSRVIGNYVQNCKVGILTEEFYYGVITSNAITRCSEYGIGLGGGTRNSSVSSNTITECGHGIYIDRHINPNTYYIADIDLIGNIVKRNNKHGIRIGGGRKTIKIIGGFIEDNGMENVGVGSPTILYAGIWAGKDNVNNDGSNSANIVISNVDLHNGYDISVLTDETAGAQAYGIYIQQSSVNRLNVQSCTLSGHTEKHIYARYMTLGLIVKDTFFQTTNVDNDTFSSLMYTSGNIGLLTEYKNGNNNFNLSGKWNEDHIVMNGNHIWVDSGKLYIKSSAPTSATDGTIIGTQT